jgi:uronate dehydrogenase
MSLPERIVMTGAAGRVGKALRPYLRERFEEVTLTDLLEIDDCQDGESFEQGDIVDYAFVSKLVARSGGIVHLAGLVASHYTFAENIGPNYQGTHNIFRAATEKGIENVVYASSHHAVGFIKRGEKIDHTTAHRPDTEYGLSKAFGESAAAYFADKFGLNILSIRIGYVGPDVPNERRLHTWVSARDLTQLIEIGLRTKGMGHQIVYGVSDCDEPFFDNSNAERLGYRPLDHSRDAVASPSVLECKPDLNSIEEGVVGGGFAAIDFSGDKDRILKST